MFATQNAFNEKHERAAHDALMSLCGTNKCNQGISIQIFVKFPTRGGACGSLVNLCKTKKRAKKTIIYSKIYVRYGVLLRTKYRTWIH